MTTSRKVFGKVHRDCPPISRHEDPLLGLDPSEQIAVLAPEGRTTWLPNNANINGWLHPAQRLPNRMRHILV